MQRPTRASSRDPPSDAKSAREEASLLPDEFSFLDSSSQGVCLAQMALKESAEATLPLLTS